MKTKAKLALLLSVLPFPLFSQLAQWNLNGSTLPSFTAPDISGSEALFGSGVGNQTFVADNDGNNPGAYSGNSWETGPTRNTDEYFQVCISATTGVLDLTNITFEERRSGTGPRTLEIRYSNDDFTNDDNFIGSVTLPDDTNWRTQSFPLTLSNESSICFRIYGYNAEAPQGTWRFDDVTISGSVLPVTWLEFRAEVLPWRAVRLEWSTATELNNHYFEVQHSLDGRQFRPLGQVPGAGNSFQVRHYAFVHESPAAGTNYYRIEQVDFDGQYSFSKVVSAELPGEGGLRIWPQPAGDLFWLELPQPSTTSLLLILYDPLGRPRSLHLLPPTQTRFQLALPPAPAGWYVLEVQGDAFR